MSTQLAAVSPSELATAQAGVLEHCVSKINAINQEIAECEANLERAMRHKWAVKPFRTRLNRLARKSDYYKKIGEAVRKGYLIIPDVWNSDLFAIRVKDKDKVRWTKYGSAHVQKLPIGEGEYIDAKPIEHSYTETDDNGRKRVVVYDREAADDIDFPVVAVHPSVMEATEIAMADKIFDTVRIARQGGDPFILGTIENPSGGYQNGITFFIAWFLDTSTV